MPITWNITKDAATWKVGASPAFATQQDLDTANAALVNVQNDWANWMDSSGTLNVTVAVQPSGSSSLPAQAVAATTWANFKSWYQSNFSTRNAINASAYASLPASDPFSITSAYITSAGIVNLLNNNNGNTSGSTVSIQRSGLGTTTDSTGIAYMDLTHELSEALLNRISQIGDMPTLAAVLDYFSYSAPGTLSNSASGRYFSWDGGVTSRGAYGAGAGGADLGDWFSTGSGSGLANTVKSYFTGFEGTPPLVLRAGDMQQLAAIGMPLSTVGTVSGLYADSGIVKAGAPLISVAPAISGIGRQGQLLSVTQGTWSGESNSFAFTYQWKRNGVAIGGATSSTYALVGSDIGTSITCDVTNTNVIAARTETANLVGPISGGSFSNVPTMGA